MKSAFIAIVGRPSSGKSTLLNCLCRHKISIVSPVPQTTRNKIRGIYTEKRGQLVFIDTPGFHLSERKFNLYLKNQVLSSFDEVDIILYLLDLSRPWGAEEESIARRVSCFGGIKQIVFNKTDLANPENRVLTGQKLAELGLPQPYLEISALHGTNTETLKDRLFEIAPPGELLYPAEFYTDQTPEFRIAEIIREKAVNLCYQEVPHALYVEIADMETAGDHLAVRAFIYVERESQKGIVVGKGGEKIRQIRLAALKEISALFPYRPSLDLRVKSRSKWRSNDNIIRNLLG